jgi:hypothetical protein
MAPSSPVRRAARDVGSAPPGTGNSLELATRHTDAAGGTWTVTLTNPPPVVDAGEDLTTDEGGTVRVDATATDPDGDALTCSWIGSSRGR